MAKNAPLPLTDLPNLGPKSQQMLQLAGIQSVQDLRRLGAVRAYLQVQACGAPASLNLLWALEGAISGLLGANNEDNVSKGHLLHANFLGHRLQGDLADFALDLPARIGQPGRMKQCIHFTTTCHLLIRFAPAHEIQIQHLA